MGKKTGSSERGARPSWKGHGASSGKPHHVQDYSCERNGNIRGLFASANAQYVKIREKF
jgi:hypothetical protein